MNRVPKLLLLSLLGASPICQSFAPSAATSKVGLAHRGFELQASAGEHNGSTKLLVEHVGKAAGSALLAFTLAFSPNVNAAIDAANTHSYSPLTSTTTLTSLDDPVDQSAILALEAETKALEKETQKLKRKARIERGREAYFDYEAKQAAETEARIEAAERKAALEYENDKEEVEALAILELKKERDAKLASTPQERRELEREARALVRKEKEIARKEKQAQRAERIYLAEEAREKEILRQKKEAAEREDAKFLEVEKEYETDAELVKEEEAELSLFKELTRKRK
ncbi:hypothetical protein HJC23_012935 [Cyclotella cryptica]|uniref:Uncharacterized protein n=1 Tax=Cyclotella cryptica TaxID=29204 RepID=A0ABD3Q206_9STRA|eukprot:CCRYP_009292-RA/>CCRYP_009292-RA protein AED:0.15 eAED:0.15 QI:0/-1/0/1/-1/1/1/0/284